MFGKSFFLNSLKYIIVSGASKGLNYLVLLYFAIGSFESQYITVLLLLSLEQLLNLVLPLNNPDIIYSKKIEDYNKIANKLISSSLVTLAIYLLFFIFFKQHVYNYFVTYNIFIFFCIFFNVLINGYLVYLTAYYKLMEEHSKALKVQSLYFISFLGILIFVFLLEDKILGFFLGKTIGFFIAFLFLKRFDISTVNFRFTMLNFDEWRKIFNLYSISILGWISGLGFMNLVKIYSTPEMVVRVGYVLNLYNIFLLLGIGINSVYQPVIKKYLIEKNKVKVKRSKYGTLMIYILVSFLAYLVFLLINFSGLLVGYGKAQEVFVEFPNTILIFVFNSLYYVIAPFYLVSDKFTTFNFVNIISYIVAALVIICGSFMGYNNYITYLVLMYLIKNSILFIYGEKKLMHYV